MPIGTSDLADRITPGTFFRWVVQTNITSWGDEPCCSSAMFALLWVGVTDRRHGRTRDDPPRRVSSVKSDERKPGNGPPQNNRQDYKTRHLESESGVIDVLYDCPMARGLKSGIPAVFRLNQDGDRRSRCNTLMRGWHSAGPTGQPQHRKEDCRAGGKNWSNPPRGFFLSNCQYELTRHPANITRGPFSVFPNYWPNKLTCDNKGNRLLTAENHSWSEEDASLAELEIWRPPNQSVAIARLRRGFEIRVDGGQK